MHQNSKIYIAGHTGLVGSALMRKLNAEGYTNIITRDFIDLDLRNQQAVFDFFNQVKPEYVFLAAARVGGILANSSYPAQFMYDNIMISTNIIHGSYLARVKKLLFLGSSCIYPRNCSQPMREEHLLTGVLEKTNEPYALAKIAGIKMCQSYNREYNTRFISCMPTNLYGPNDNFDTQNGHVIPALLAKFVQAKEQNLPAVTCWGTGKARREFLYVDDLADALIFLMHHYENYGEQSWINIGTGEDITIAELAIIIKEVVGYSGTIHFDQGMPDGTPRKLLDITLLKELGWRHKIDLRDGISRVLDSYYLNNKNI